ncbi:Protein of unknown function [Aquimarina amphilecti]|uniref:DUF2975 domain-containing protein n=1 Tax=Aquimarina amphilecti TaxID=1038014 RepID=A0A1H7KN23_AQUAM|nr:DUF2975 domain-containing protein [Aquimarina amphilecti]SEK88172.1 Protein of unknown function [Aquimarina amphilecti]
MKTKQIITLMKIVSWILFISLCIKLGAILISGGISLLLNLEATENLYLDLDLSNLYKSSVKYYVFVLSLIVSVTALKAYLFYLVIKIFSIIDFNKPFTKVVARLISSISYISLWAGLLAYIANRYCKWLQKKDIVFKLDWGSSEFLFMAGIIFIIAFIFKRGVEIQSENQLTV